MEIFDPGLQPDRRAGSTVPADRDGQSESDGITAHYSLAFDQGADGLLTITVVPKR